MLCLWEWHICNLVGRHVHSWGIVEYAICTGKNKNIKWNEDDYIKQKLDSEMTLKISWMTVKLLLPVIVKHTFNIHFKNMNNACNNISMIKWIKIHCNGMATDITIHILCKWLIDCWCEVFSQTTNVYYLVGRGHYFKLMSLWLEKMNCIYIRHVRNCKISISCGTQYNQWICQKTSKQSSTPTLNMLFGHGHGYVTLVNIFLERDMLWKAVMTITMTIMT